VYFASHPNYAEYLLTFNGIFEERLIPELFPEDVLVLRVFVKKEEAVLKEAMFYGIVDQLLQKSVLIPCQRPLVFYDVLLL